MPNCHLQHAEEHRTRQAGGEDTDSLLDVYSARPNRADNLTQRSSTVESLYRSNLLGQGLQ